jgi:hypothetical protein
MAWTLLIPLIAGAASAMMFASITTGAPTALFLFYLSPLPLMTAALGWGAINALVGGIIGAGIVGFLFGWPHLAGFAIAIAFPSWWSGRLALLARAHAANDEQAALEWYPIGQLVLWLAGCAVIIALSGLLTLGSDEASIHATLRAGLARVIGVAPAPGDGATLIDFLIQTAPAAAASVAMMALVGNLWLAARALRSAGRLLRPWPDLRAIRYPNAALVALALTGALSLAGGLFGMAAQAAFATLTVAYGLSGLGLIHLLTGTISGRGFILATIYAAVLIFGWPGLILSIAGIADALFNRRARFLNRPQPPTLTS